VWEGGVARLPLYRFDGVDAQTNVASRNGNLQIFFTLFVDAIFTTLLEPLFTNALDVIREKSMRDCVCRARHAD
jgi:hypothetical protein